MRRLTPVKAAFQHPRAWEQVRSDTTLDPGPWDNPEMAPPKKSSLWLYFEEIPETASEKKKGRCKTCGVILKMSQSSTTALKNHLRSRHKDEYTRFLAQDAAAKIADEEALVQVQAAEEATGHVVSQGEL